MTDQVVFAEELLREMLTLLGFSHTIEIKTRNNITLLCIEGCEDCSRLIGKDGHILDDMQLLMNLMILKQRNERSQIMVDISGYRERRQRHGAAF